MSTSPHEKMQARRRRHHRVRKKIIGTADRPRLAVYRSNKHMVAQLIDDRQGRTLAAASTHETDVTSGATGNKDGAANVGRLLAERARTAGIARVVFDRGGFRYHGRVAALAQAARDGGLEF